MILAVEVTRAGAGQRDAEREVAARALVFFDEGDEFAEDLADVAAVHFVHDQQVLLRRIFAGALGEAEQQAGFRFEDHGVADGLRFEADDEVRVVVRLVEGRELDLAAGEQSLEVTFGLVFGVTIGADAGANRVLLRLVRLSGAGRTVVDHVGGHAGLRRRFRRRRFGEFAHVDVKGVDQDRGLVRKLGDVRERFGDEVAYFRYGDGRPRQPAHATHVLEAFAGRFVAVVADDQAGDVVLGLGLAGEDEVAGPHMLREEPAHERGLRRNLARIGGLVEFAQLAAAVAPAAGRGDVIRKVEQLAGGVAQRSLQAVITDGALAGDDGLLGRIGDEGDFIPELEAHFQEVERRTLLQLFLGGLRAAGRAFFARRHEQGGSLALAFVFLGAQPGQRLACIPVTADFAGREERREVVDAVVRFTLEVIGVVPEVALAPGDIPPDFHAQLPHRLLARIPLDEDAM